MTPLYLLPLLFTPCVLEGKIRIVKIRSLDQQQWFSHQIEYIINQMLQPESQNFLDPGLAKPQSQLNLGFKNTDLG